MPQPLFKQQGRALQRIAASVRNAGQLFLFLDYDGTIVPLRKIPRRAILSRRMRTLLLRLRKRRATSLGIITGRSLVDIKNLLRLKGILLVANHGFEILSGGDHWMHPRARKLHPQLVRLSGTLRRRTRLIQGVLIENKRGTITIHYRNVSPSRISHVRAIVEACVHPYRAIIKTTSGKKVIELRPNVPWGKGHAIRRILQRLPGSGNRLIVYCGDDVTDEDAFRRLPQDAVTVHVGKDRSSRARFSVRNVSEMHRLLTVIDIERKQAHKQRITPPSSR